MTRANEAVLKKAAKWDALGNPEDRWKLEKAKRQDEETLKEKVSRRKENKLAPKGASRQAPKGRVSLGRYGLT